MTFMDYVLTCVGAGLLGAALALAWGTAAIRLPVAVAVAEVSECSESAGSRVGSGVETWPMTCTT